MQDGDIVYYNTDTLHSSLLGNRSALSRDCPPWWLGIALPRQRHGNDLGKAPVLLPSVVTPIQAARLECMAYGMAVSMAVVGWWTGQREEAGQ